MAPKTDEELVEEFFVSAVRAVGALVTNARRNGCAIGELAVVLVVLFVEIEGFIVVGIRRWSAFPPMESDVRPARQSFG